MKNTIFCVLRKPMSVLSLPPTYVCLFLASLAVIVWHVEKLRNGDSSESQRKGNAHSWKPIPDNW
jgi:hypothetical protein